MLATIIGLKPVVDVFWWVSFGEIDSQRLNVPAIFVLLIALAGVVALAGRRGRLDYPLLGATLLSALSLVAWGNWGGTLDLTRLAVLPLLFAAVALPTFAALERFASTFVISTIAICPLMLLQISGQLEYLYFDWIGGERIGRPSAYLPHPLGFVYLAIPALIMAHALYRINRNRGRDTLALAFLLATYLLTGATILTTHRLGGLLAASLLLFIEFRGHRGGVRIGRIRFLVLGGFLAAVLFERVMQSFSFFWGQSGSFEFERVGRGRFELWSLYLEDWVAGGPIVWLIGKGTVELDFGLYSSFEPHNDALRILVTSGIIVVALLGIFFRRLWRVGSAAQDSNFGTAILGDSLRQMVIATVLLSIYTEPTRYPSGVWALLVVGATLSARVRVKECAPPSRAALPSRKAANSRIAT